MIILQAVADGSLGGGTTHVLQLIESLRAEVTAEVHLLSQAGSPALEAAARLGAAAHGLDFFAARADPRIWRRIRALVGDLRPALVHAHGARAGLPLAAARGAARFVYSVHGYHFVHKRWPGRALGRAAERFVARRADLRIFVSEHDRAVAAEWGIGGAGEEHRVIPNGIRLDDLPSAPDVRGRPLRTLLFLGRLDPIKNPLLALEILAGLDDPEIRLVVVGDGPLRAAMVARARALRVQDRVVMRGALARPEALDVLAGADLMLLPSRSEGLPLAPIEAMAVGVPVVAARVGGVPEAILDGRTGLLVDGLQASGYIGAVRRLQHDEALRADLVAAGRARARSVFDWSVTGRAYLELYRDLLRRP
ncbi:MAG TPA: glycosyltransferase family 4 protein [Geminicoccaceae bacterium]